MSVIVLMLERYKLEHGDYPKNLDLLSPEYCESVPLDPFSQAPFNYHAAQDGFTLYSVGANLRDDEGISVFAKDAADDWRVEIRNDDWSAIQQEIRGRYDLEFNDSIHNFEQESREGTP